MIISRAASLQRSASACQRAAVRALANRARATFRSMQSSRPAVNDTADTGKNLLPDLSTGSARLNRAKRHPPLRLNPQSAKQPAPGLNPAVRSVNPSRTAPGPHRTLQIPQGHRSAVQRNSGALLARLRHRIRWVILHFPLSTGIQSRHSTCEHDHRQSPCQRYDRLRSTAPAGNIQCPGL